MNRVCAWVLFVCTCSGLEAMDNQTPKADASAVPIEKPVAARREAARRMCDFFVRSMQQFIAIVESRKPAAAVDVLSEKAVLGCVEAVDNVTATASAYTRAEQNSLEKENLRQLLEEQKLRLRVSTQVAKLALFAQELSNAGARRAALKKKG